MTTVADPTSGAEPDDPSVPRFTPEQLAAIRRGENPRRAFTPLPGDAEALSADWWPAVRRPGDPAP